MIEIKFIKQDNKAVAYEGKSEIGICEYVENKDTWNIIHTIVNNDYQGQGIAKRLVECVIDNEKKNSKKVIAECSYAKKILDRI